jgi:hypothetical protein
VQDLTGLMKSVAIRGMTTLAALCVASCGGAATPGPATGGRGLAFYRSDTPDVPDAPLERGSVVFIPRHRVAALETAVEVEGLGTQEAAYIGFSLDSATLASIGGTAREISSAGRFTVAPAGDVLVCLADIRPDDDPLPPFSIVGCALVSIPPESAFLEMGFGEGGVEGRIVRSPAALP